MILTIVASCNEDLQVEKITDKNQTNSGSPVNSGNSSWNTFDYNIYVGLQDTSLDNFLYQFSFNNASPLSTALTIVDSSPIVVGGNIRSISMNNDGNIIMGGTAELSPPIYDKDYALLGSHAPTGAVDPEVNTHSLCALPNGHYILSEDGDATGNIANEYDENDNFVRNVYTTVLGNHGAISECYAPDNNTIIMVEVEAWNLAESNLLRLTLVGNTWGVTHTLNSNTFDPGNQTNFWSIIYHTDGFIYFPSFKRNAPRFAKMVKCPVDNISMARCSAVGDDIPGAGTGGYLTWARGGVQIPGSDDMIVFLSQEVLHYNYATGAYTSLMDLSATVTAIDVVRTVILAPK